MVLPPEHKRMSYQPELIELIQHLKTVSTLYIQACLADSIDDFINKNNIIVTNISVIIINSSIHNGLFWFNANDKLSLCF